MWMTVFLCPYRFDWSMKSTANIIIIYIFLIIYFALLLKDVSFLHGQSLILRLIFTVGILWTIYYCALYILRCLIRRFKVAHLGGKRISSSVMTSWNAEISLSYFSSWKTELIFSDTLIWFNTVNVYFLKTKIRPLFRCFLWTRPGASKQITWSLFEGEPSDGLIKRRTEKKEWSIEKKAKEQNMSKEKTNPRKDKE